METHSSAAASAMPEVNRVEHIAGERGGLHVFVQDAGGEIPHMLAMLREKIGLTPQVAEPYVPPFDEVFVRLIRTAETKQAAQVQPS